MGGEDSFAGLSVDRQQGIIGAVGLLLLVASYRVGSPIDQSYNPTLYAIGVVCLLYAGLRFGYERLR